VSLFLAEGLNEPLLGSYSDGLKVILLFQITRVFCKQQQQQQQQSLLQTPPIILPLASAPDYSPDLQIPPRNFANDN
jgi:hypothetical protein